MPKHLYTIPTGTSLPVATDLPQGYPYLLETGTGLTLSRALYQLQGTAFVRVVPPDVDLQRFDLQTLLAGDAVVKNNALPPGLYVPAAVHLVGLVAALGTAPVGADLVFTVTNAGTMLASVTIAAGSTAAAVQLNIAVDAGSYLQLNVTAIGSTTPGADLSVALQGSYDAA